MDKYIDTKADQEAIEVLWALVEAGDEEIRRVQGIIYAVARGMNSFRVWDKFLKAYSTVDDRMIEAARKRDASAGAVLHAYQELDIGNGSPRLLEAFVAYCRALAMVGMTAHQRLAWLAAHPA